MKKLENDKRILEDFLIHSHHYSDFDVFESIINVILANSVRLNKLERDSKFADERLRIIESVIFKM
ncbi:hypothetical protein AB6E39_06880 [Vibrio splendidus]|uniref:hypothetical protein n=1 Tax=Vibrio splendidus TaxID=29497 RepID=UPI001E5DD52A|nr:hypothetical protein [Vibrio splendidus]MCC4787699.1 hypothetical protein [Vibrio splendidus]